MNQLRLRSLAKINLGLDVLYKRDDGYHQVRMIMQTINLYDQIIITRTNSPDIRIKTNLPYLPENENNLAYKAAKMLKDEFAIKQGVFIELKKYIPVAAGLAGGSSNAASVLHGMNRMFGLRLGLTDLMKRGQALGADVPYCLMRGTALAEGIGEKLTKLTPVPKCYILVAKPGANVSTKFVYENLKLDDPSAHPDIDRILQGIGRRDLETIAGSMGNILETVTIPAHPVIEDIKSVMKSYGALNAMMSGSGPTVFGIFNDIRKAKRAYYSLKADSRAKQVYLTSTYGR